MSERVRSIADGQQRQSLLWYAARWAVELAEEDFYHAMATEGMDDESLAVFARQAYEKYNAGFTYDYPQYAEALFLKAYALVYRERLADLVNGVHRSVVELVAAAGPHLEAPALGGHPA